MILWNVNGFNIKSAPLSRFAQISFPVVRSSRAASLKIHHGISASFWTAFSANNKSLFRERNKGAIFMSTLFSHLQLDTFEFYGFRFCSFHFVEFLHCFGYRVGAKNLKKVAAINFHFHVYKINNKRRKNESKVRGITNWQRKFLTKHHLDILREVLLFDSSPVLRLFTWNSTLKVDFML